MLQRGEIFIQLVDEIARAVGTSNNHLWTRVITMREG